MGTLTPILSTIAQTTAAATTISQTVDRVSGRDQKQLKAQQELALKNLQDQQNLAQRQALEKANLDRDRIAADAKNTEDARRKALRRAMARQNVQFGASGVSRSGSGEAVLLGLYNDSEDDAAYNQTLDQIRYNVIDNDLANLQSQNILQRSQLAERQRLEREFSKF